MKEKDDKDAALWLLRYLLEIMFRILLRLCRRTEIALIQKQKTRRLQSTIP